MSEQIREQIAKWFNGDGNSLKPPAQATPQQVQAHLDWLWEHTDTAWRNRCIRKADQILNDVKARRERKCPECKGEKKVLKENRRDAVGDVYTEIIDCPTCKGFGTVVEEKSLGTILAEGEWK